MSRKRSKYRPKGVRLDAVTWVVGGFQTLASIKDEHLLLVTKNHSAMAEITQGRGSRDHIDTLIAALNMTEALARVRDSLGKDWAGEIRAGQDALLAMTKRGIAREDRFVFTGPEMAAINLSLEIHDAQLAQCTVAELDKALDIVRQEIKLNRARSIERKEMVCGS